MEGDQQAREAVYSKPATVYVPCGSMQDPHAGPGHPDYMANNTNSLSHTLLYSQQQINPIPNTTIVSSNVPDQDVLSVSHLGLMTPPTHPWFGRDGIYRNCSHYASAENPLFVQCKNGARDFYAETTAENEQLVLSNVSCSTRSTMQCCSVCRYSLMRSTNPRGSCIVNHAG